MEIVDLPDFENDYERILKNLFETTHNHVIRKEEKFKDDYDPYLSGAVVTLIIKKDNIIYCANVGNVLAFLFYSERVYSYKFKTKGLTIDNSNFKADFHSNIGTNNLLNTNNMVISTSKINPLLPTSDCNNSICNI